MELHFPFKPEARVLSFVFHHRHDYLEKFVSK